MENPVVLIVAMDVRRWIINKEIGIIEKMVTIMIHTDDQFNHINAVASLSMITKSSI